MLTWEPSRFHDALRIGPFARLSIFLLSLIWLSGAIIRIGFSLFVSAPGHSVQEDMSVPFFVEPAQSSADQRKSKRHQKTEKEDI